MTLRESTHLIYLHVEAGAHAQLTLSPLHSTNNRRFAVAMLASRRDVVSPFLSLSALFFLSLSLSLSPPFFLFFDRRSINYVVSDLAATLRDHRLICFPRCARGKSTISLGYGRHNENANYNRGNGNDAAAIAIAGTQNGLAGIKI